MVAAPIDAYVTALGSALRGPRGAKADLLTEARDSLHDAAEHYEHAGLDRLTAERMAVDEFGDLRELTPDYQRELALAQARRTALFVGGVVAAENVIAELAWRSAAVGQTWTPNAGYALLANAVDYASYGVLISALAVALACGVGARYLSVGRSFVRATGITAIAACAFFTLGGMILSALSPWHGMMAPSTPLDVLTSVLTVTLTASMVYSGFRCIHTARRPTLA